MRQPEHPEMEHGRLWAAIDAIALSHGLSPSGLARRAGLDATAFNKSKRFTSDGRPRWPSTESIAKILVATGARLDEFARLVCGDESPPARSLPFLDFDRAAAGGFFDGDGRPAPARWDAVSLPWADDETLYALEVTHRDMQPIYRPGDILIVSPTVPIRPGDRVVVRTSDGRLSAHVYVSTRAGEIELADFGRPRTRRSLSLSTVPWIARILWVSQ